MTNIIEYSAKKAAPGTAFLAFNSKLPLIAAKAAVEIEIYRKDKTVNLSSVLELSEIVVGEGPPNASPSPCQKRLHDPLGASVLTRAYNSSHKAEATQNQQNPLQATLDVVDQLTNIDANLTDMQLMKLRDFCISLAEFSAMSSKRVSDERPKHPHQKMR